ncbi:hypothetical protein [Cerasicoccus arenae]|uniref:Glutamate-ammonia-ligase adenylyltransferase n=1 Tax=Cerasicoccus arenae TaxID=424488 RepID=A0A8J3GCV9_9BACT|nr:hypothetical protein [Cerasicoccus arenae]MBK1857710.1 hypothetical protein [Cerasicoccus arenae]GHB91229.1 glutamate-ammonia-ligase adenylyltransferase [Cerasicoccus arenae]
MSVENRIQRLQAASPFYAQQLRLHPDWIDWLDKPKNREFEYRYSSLEDLWRRRFCEGDFSLDALRQFRRRMSMRIAYREVNGLADVATSWRELSMLAEFILRRLCDWRLEEWRERYGEPYCEETGQPTRYCIFALGKLGAGELNFCSDIDLIFSIDGNGFCRKHGRTTSVTSREFYDRFFRQLAVDLTANSPDGQLYYLDLRLRPDGEGGALVRTADSLINYYWDAGQTWERLAWLRARPVAGDLALGHGVLEEINPFRYPRFPPHKVMNEVAGVKIRTEAEVPADKIALDIKTGPGGIREIEFIVQALQLVHGGRNPFLQTCSTIEGLEKLARYGVLTADDACFLDHAYRRLRLLENRLQMRGERPRHSLPTSVEDKLWLIETMGVPSWDEFVAELDHWRSGVRQRYMERFAADPQETVVQAWTSFLAGQAPGGGISDLLSGWFPNSEDTEQRLRRFVLGDSPGLITRDSVLRFLDLAAHFDRILPRLARPMQTLERIGRFAESYGARRHFFRDSSNPALFESLSLLFDRSTFIYELLCRYPGMMEELLHEAPRRLKSRDECRAEIELLQGEKGGGADRLWLYVKAEQVRLAMAELLHGVTLESVGWALSQLAEAVVLDSMQSVGIESVMVVSLGKFGAEELSLGSDLDLLLLAEEPLSPKEQAKLRAWLALLTYNAGLGPMFEIDLRLRPYGDVGPLAMTLSGLIKYHASGQAKRWEKQILVRARTIAGSAVHQASFNEWRDELLYRTVLPAEEAGDLWRMRLKIERDKPAELSPPQRAFKTGPGGLLDLEFLAELLALMYGAHEPELRQPHARTCFLVAASKGLMGNEIADQLIENWNALRLIEFNLRRQNFQPVTELPDDDAIARTLALWIGPSELSEFWRRYLQILAENRRTLTYWLKDSLAKETSF